MTVKRIPSPPVNVRILDIDQNEHPAVLGFDGWDRDTGYALWTAMPALFVDDAAHVLMPVWRADSVPPNTKLRVKV